MVYSVGSRLESFFFLSKPYYLQSSKDPANGPTQMITTISHLAHTKTAKMSHEQESSSVSMNSSDVNANTTAYIVVMIVVFILVIITTTIINVERDEPSFRRGRSLSVAVSLPPSCRVSAHAGCANLPPPCQPYGLETTKCSR